LCRRSEEASLILNSRPAVHSNTDSDAGCARGSLVLEPFGGSCPGAELSARDSQRGGPASPGTRVPGKQGGCRLQLTANPQRSCQIPLSPSRPSPSGFLEGNNERKTLHSLSPHLL